MAKGRKRGGFDLWIYTNEGETVCDELSTRERQDSLTSSDKSLKSGGAMTIDGIQLSRRVAIEAMGAMM